MKSDYLVGIPIMVLNTLCVASVSVLYDLAIDCGFNIFEIMFLRGFIGLIFGIILDTSKKCFQSKNTHVHKQDFDNIGNPKHEEDASLAANTCRELLLDGEPSIDETHSLLTSTATDNDSIGNRYVSSTMNYNDTCIYSTEKDDLCIGRIDCVDGCMNSDIFYTLRLMSCRSLNGENSGSIWLWLRGFGRLMTSFLYFLCLTWIQIGTCIALNETTPIWSLLIDKFLFGIKLGWMHYLVTVLVTIGVILVAQPEFLFNSSDHDAKTNSSLLTAIGYIAGIGSGIFEAFGFAAMQKFSNVEKMKNNINISDESIIFAGMYSVVIQYAIFGIIGSYLVYDEFLFNKLTIVGIDGILYALGVCIIGLVIIIVINFAVSRLTVNEMSLLTLTEVMWGYLFEVGIFGESPNWIEIVGIVLIVLPMACFFGYNVYKEKQQPQTN